MKRNKILIMLLLTIFVFSSFVLASCDKNKPTPSTNPVKPVDGDKDEDKEKKYDFMNTDFIIMVDIVDSMDPRSDGYQQLFKAEKKALIEKVEEKYNINVVFKAYPSEASWGGARERYIIQNSASNTPKAHVYQVPSYSIGTLAVSKAISPLDSYIDLYGDDRLWPEAYAYGTTMGEVYGYGDIYPIADEGIFYNIDLLERYLGEGNGDLPSRLWLEGKWDWAAFENMCKQLDELLPSDHYVLGGAGYNWAYQMLGANGVHMVDTNLKCELASQGGVNTITYMNNLFHSVRWDINVDASNATSKEMVNGKVAFHNGQSYWIFQSNKWLEKDFKIGFVPYPVGDDIKDEGNLDHYYINDVYGKTQYVISSSYSKSLIQPGYEDSTLHDEIIFQIWTELQYFPEADETGYASRDEYIDAYELSRLGKYYGSESSIEAHKSIIKKAYPDYYYSLDEAKSHSDGSYLFILKSTITEDVDGVRQSLINIQSMIEQSFKSKYSLPDDFYE